jgi:hypothetical protein
VCRDLSSYLVSLPPPSCAAPVNARSRPCTTSSGPAGAGAGADIESTDKGESNNSTSNNSCSEDDTLILMSAMSFMKLQICYFGNMALRSSMSFAIVGSLLAAVIPVLIEKEG